MISLDEFYNLMCDAVSDRVWIHYDSDDGEHAVSVGEAAKTLQEHSDLTLQLFQDPTAARYHVPLVVASGSNAYVVEAWVNDHKNQFNPPDGLQVQCVILKCALPALIEQLPYLPLVDVEFPLPHKITPYLYLGDWDSAQCPALPHIVSGVVDVSNAGLGCPFQLEYLALMDIFDCELDAAVLASKFQVVVDFVSREPTAVTLIHCSAGVSRSATLAIAVLMLREGMALENAWFHVKRIRKIINPNPGFSKQLVLLQNRIHGTDIAICEDDSLDSLFPI